MSIRISRPSEEELARRGVRSWPIWEKEISTFSWHYDEPEQCLFLEGEVEVGAGTETFRIHAGDFVEFPQGLSCVWKVLSPVRKHYNFG